MDLPLSHIAQMIDASAVRPDSSDERVIEAVDCARKYGCYLVTVLPSQNRLLKELLQGQPTPRAGGNVGFPSGGQTTSIKVLETKELVRLGVDEIDMVINVGALISNHLPRVGDDIRAVVDAAESKPVKVILECHYLTEDQIRTGCDLAIQAGAAFVKTGTGWAPSGATLENVALIKKHVGNAILIKASGGVRGVETIQAMYSLGASRFGISARSIERIFTAQFQVDSVQPS